MNNVNQNKMEKEFVTYELAVKLKALGFDEECLSYYFNKQLSFGSKTSYGEVVEAPLYQQAFRWFREKYELYSTIMFRVSMEDNNEYWDWLIKGEEVVYRHFKTYEEAELACLIKLIEIVVQQKQN